MHIMTDDEILREKMIEREEFYADMRWLKDRTTAAEKRANVAEIRANMAEAELAEYKAKYGEL